MTVSEAGAFRDAGGSRPKAQPEVAERKLPCNSKQQAIRYRTGPTGGPGIPE